MDEIAAGPSPWAYLDALGEGVYGVDILGRCLFANAAAVRILGYDRADELVGLNMHETIHHTRPDGSAFPQAECPLLHTGHSGRPVRLENELLWRRDGTSFFAEYSSYPVPDGARSGGSVVTFAENIVRQDARVRLAVQHAVSQVLAEAVGRDEMLARILQTIGRGFGWDAGLFWRQDEAGGDALGLAGSWHAPDAGNRDGLPGGTDLPADGPGGLALRAWRERGPVHVADLAAGLAAGSADARLPAVAGRGLRSGIAFPVWMGPAVAGVVEFYDHDVIEADDTLLEAVTVLGQMMGRALERHQIASDLRRSEARSAPSPTPCRSCPG